jgi:hypothetical protein
MRNPVITLPSLHRRRPHPGPFRALAGTPLMAATVALLLVLQGCSTPQPPVRPTSPPATSTATPPAQPGGPAAAPGATTPQPGTPAAATAPRGGALVVERQWLQSWFTGTPVRIVQQGSGPVAIEVPQAFCFDGGPQQRQAAAGGGAGQTGAQPAPHAHGATAVAGRPGRRSRRHGRTGPAARGPDAQPLLSRGVQCWPVGPAHGHQGGGGAVAHGTDGALSAAGGSVAG